MGIEKLNMKISSNLLLPILLADAKRTKSRKQKLRKVENSGDRSIKDGDRNVFLPSDHSSSNCAERVEGTGAYFESSVAANGLSGKVKLSDYQDSFECMHEIVADESCQAIVVEYESVAVEPCGQGCECDQFRFGWSNGSEELQTPANCHCNNDASCDVIIAPDSYHNGDNLDYQSLGEYEDSYLFDYGDWMLPSDGFSVNANKFKFYFMSDPSWYKGHVHFKWECVENEVTTQSLTTTSNYLTTSAPPTTTTYYEPTTTTYYEPTTTTYYYEPTTTTSSTTSTSEYYSSSTSSSYAHTVYDTTVFDSDCKVRLVYNHVVCNEEGSDYANAEMKAKWPRLATYQEVKSQTSYWQSGMLTWGIVGFQQGYANGPGYGNHIVSAPEFNWDKPPCHKYGQLLMCLSDDVEETTSTTTTAATSTSWYPDYESTTTTAYSTPGDDSCYKYHAGFEEFGDAVKAGIRQGLHNDIMSYSRRPGVITNGAIMRREQWYNWFASNVDIWLYEVDTIGERKCLTDKFPYDSPGDLDKSILGSDCALDLTSIDAICENLPKFMDWAFADCRSNARTRQLHQRCVKLRRVRSNIQAHPWTSGPWIVNPWGSETTTSASTTT